jgi:parallel beta-helix repeat protein
MFPAIGFLKEDGNVIFINNLKDAQDLKGTILTAATNTQIVFDEGHYVLDNPIIVTKNGIEVIGKGRDKTYFYPKNAGRPVFIFRANDIVIKKVTIDAKVNNNFGRATFAIQIEEDYEKFNISKINILGTGASSILAPRANNVTIRDNMILNAGDDAIQIRGTELKIIDNIIIRYFDEGIDIAKGENFVVERNYLESGRIGVVLDHAVNASIRDNIVKDHLQQGIVLNSEENGIVSGNILKDNLDIGFQLFSPKFVAHNRIVGKHKIGFDINNMNNGIIEYNMILNRRSGIKIHNSIDNLIQKNIFCVEKKLLESEVLEYRANTIKNNMDKCPESGSLNDEDLIAGSIEKNKADTIEEGRKIVSARSKDKINIKVDGKTNRDKKIAKEIVKFLTKNNPGFISIKVNHGSMTSMITDELFTILRGSGKLGIGLVRYPFLAFKRRSNSRFPVWSLYLDGEKVALISYMTSGANARIYFTKNGKLGLKNSFFYYKDYFFTLAKHIIKKLTKVLKN